MYKILFSDTVVMQNVQDLRALCRSHTSTKAQQLNPNYIQICIWICIRLFSLQPAVHAWFLSAGSMNYYLRNSRKCQKQKKTPRLVMSNKLRTFWIYLFVRIPNKRWWDLFSAEIFPQSFKEICSLVFVLSCWRANHQEIINCKTTDVITWRGTEPVGMLTTCLSWPSLYKDETTFFSNYFTGWKTIFSAALWGFKESKSAHILTQSHCSISVSSYHVHRQITVWNLIWWSSAVRPIRWNWSPAHCALCELVKH